MITVDVVMPTGGSAGGGVETILYEWSRNIPDDEIRLRFFHISPGQADYLKGYKDQWTLPMPEEGMDKLTLEYCAKAYAFFVQQQGAPDICLATWIPLVSMACRAVRDSLELSFPVISFIHSVISAYEPYGLGGMKELSAADGHICISKIIENEILSADPNAFTLNLGNPINPVEINENAPDDRTICFAGRLAPEKNVDYIIQAIAEAKDKNWKLLIAGKGVFMESLKQLSKELGVEDRVTFLGWLEKPWESMKKARFCVLASDYEGCNGTTREASSIGMTVISTPVGGVVDYIVPGVNGYLYSKDKVENLTTILDGISDGILPICDTDACKKSVEPYHTDRYFANLKNIFKSLVAND